MVVEQQNEKFVEEHSFSPRYRELLTGIPVKLTWQLLCIFENNGGFEAVELFLLSTHIHGCNWAQVNNPAEYVQNNFFNWLKEVPITNL